MKKTGAIFFALIIFICFTSSNITAFCNANYPDELKITKVCTGCKTCYAIDDKGRLWAWGDLSGVLNQRGVSNYLPVYVMDGVKDVAAGISNCYVIKDDNTLWAWGWNYQGRLGDGTTVNRESPVKIMDDIKAMFVTFNQAAAIKSDNSLWMWGDNEDDYSILGDGTKITRTSPVKIMDNVKKVSYAINNLILQNNGKLWRVDSISRKPVLVQEFGDVADIARGYYVLLSDSRLYFYNPHMGVNDIIGYGIKKMCESSYNNYYLTEDNSLWGNGDSYVGYGPNDSSQQPILKNVKDFSNNEYNSIALLEDGSVWTWGNNYEGEIGNGTTSPFLKPVKITFSQTALSILTAFDGIDYKLRNYIPVIYDGQEIKFDVYPQIINGRTLVPMRAIFEKFGLSVSWDNVNKIAKGTSQDDEISFKMGSNIAVVNGSEKTLEVPAQVINGRTMIPLRFLSENLGYNVVWVRNTKMILVSKNDIIEWRYGGHEKIEPHAEYEYKYVNGVKTSEYRYTGTNWSQNPTPTPEP